MRKLALCLALVLVPLILSGCEDRDARAWIREIRDTMKARSVTQQAWDMKVQRAICNLDRAITEEGISTPNPEWGFCLSTTPPPEPPDPINNPWLDEAGDGDSENGGDGPSD
jgi:hypothetical protein